MNAIPNKPPDRFSTIAEKIIDGYTYGKTHFSRHELHALIPYVVMHNEERHTLAYQDAVNRYGRPDRNDHIGFYIEKLYDDVVEHSAEASAILAEMTQNVFTRHSFIKHVWPQNVLESLDREAS